jgi:hypothetical protein
LSVLRSISFSPWRKMFFYLGLFSVPNLETYVPSLETCILSLETYIPSLGIENSPRRKNFLSGSEKLFVPGEGTFITNRNRIK